MNPDLLEQLRALMQQRPDATRAPMPQRQPVPTMRAQMANAMPVAPDPSAAQQAVSVAQEFVPGLAEGMGTRRMVEELLSGRKGRAALEGAGVLASAVPFVSEARGARKGIQAYHGSPSLFERFADEFALTGEGAQARGHGSYLGTSRAEIEREYKKGRGSILLNEQVVRPSAIDVTPGAREAFDAVGLLKRASRQLAEEGAAGNRPPHLLANSKLLQDIAQSDDAYKRAMDLAERAAGQRTPDELEQILSFLRNRSVRENPGFLYDVNVQVNPQRFLSWNAPLERQPQFTQRALRGTNAPELAEAVATAPIRAGATSPTGGDILRNLESALTQERLPKGQSSLSLLTSGKYREAQAQGQRQARDILANEGLEFTQYTPFGGGPKSARGQHLIVYDPERIRIQNIMAALGLMAGGSAMTTPPDVEENP